MNIKPGIGIEHFIFGMKQEEIEALLGTPDRIILEDEYGESNIMVQYNSIQTRFTFYNNHDGKMGYIRTSHPNLSFDNQKIIRKKFTEVIKIFNIIPEDKWEKEESDFWCTYFFEPLWIELRFNYDTLSEIEIGVPFKNENDYNWPEL